jgi:branched-chain amino acid aminotransferase
MASSASAVSIPPIPPSIFIDSVKLAVSRNAEYVPPHEAEALLYVRPVVFGSSGHLGLTAPEEFTFCVYTQPGNAYHGVRAMDALILEDYDRAAPNGTGAVKVGGNYAPVIKWSNKARAEGYGITLHLDSKTQSEIEEFSTSGFVGVKTDGDGYTLVVPDSKNVVQSVTSESCMELAKSQGWKVEKRPVSRPWAYVPRRMKNGLLTRHVTAD